jgi:DUF1680 family protein
MELTLYNSFLSGVSLDGRRYFYVNPLLSRGSDPLLGRKRVERPEWHGCACCPPNVMRLLATLNHYFATVDESGLQLHLYDNATIDAAFGANGARSRHANLSISGNYPWSGAVEIKVNSTGGEAWTLALRVPDWARGVSATVNGKAIESSAPDGYLRIKRTWQADDTVTVDFAMQPEALQAHPHVDPARASLTLRRGPLLYCLEDVDQPEGVSVEDVAINRNAQVSTEWQPDLLHGITTLHVEGFHTPPSAWGEALYLPLSEVTPAEGESVQLTAVPYYAWANRGANAMRVWIPMR